MRWRVQGEYRLSALSSLRTPGSFSRRAVTIAASLVATYLAVVAIAAVFQFGYSTTGPARYAVMEVLPDGAAVGILQKDDRIDAVDGKLLFVDDGPSLVERVQAKGGAPVELTILRDGAMRTVQVTPKLMKDARGESKFLLGIRPRVHREHSTDGALARAFAFPFVHAVQIARDAWEWATGSEQVEIAGVVRITEEFQRAVDPFPLILILASHYATYLLLACAVLDLLRAFVLIRDKVRA